MAIFHSKENLSLGARGEKAATNYLKKCGYKILEINFYNKVGRRLGEIDIIAKDKLELVFVEVKTRISSQTSQTLPEENITREKLYKLNKAASFYLNKNNLHDLTYRFDAITLVAEKNSNSAKLKHIKNIFY